MIAKTEPFINSIRTCGSNSEGLVIIDNLEFVVYSITIGFRVGYSMVNLSLIKLRRSKPHLNRPFKTPLYQLMPIIGIVTSLMLFAFFEVKPLALGTAWGLRGTIIYYFRQKNKYHSA